MKSAPVFSVGVSACTQVGRATQRAATFIAGSFLCFGAALAFCNQASSENRLEYLFFVGVVPAVVSYLSGYIVRLTLEFSCELCEAAAARCLRLLSHLAVYLAIRTGARVVALADGSERLIGLSLLMIGRCAERYDFRRKAYRVHRWSWRTRNAIFQFLCLLIRSTARFLIELQHLFERTRREQIARHAEQFPADSELRSSRARE
jgi:hypothetical protein